MSGKVYKLIKKYAGLRKLNYKKCKRVYSNADPKEKKLYLEEMKNASFNTPPVEIK